MERSEAATGLIQWANDEQEQRGPDFKMCPQLFNRLLDLLVEYDRLRRDVQTLIRANDNYGMVIQQRDLEIADKLQRMTELSGLNGRLCREKAELQERNDSQAITIRDFQRETGRWGGLSKDEVIDELRNLALKMGIETGEKDLVILDLTKRLEQAEKSQDLQDSYSLLERDYEERWAELVEAQAELAQLRRERDETPPKRLDRLEKIMRESLAEIKEHRRQTR